MQVKAASNRPWNISAFYNYNSFCQKHSSQIALVKQFDPNFSIDEFKANIENKMAYVHYAVNQQQLAPFTMINLSGLLNYYSNVLNSNLEEILITNFRVDQWNQVIDADILIALERLVGNQVTLTYEWVRAVFVKNKNNKTQTSNDVITYKCKNCGGNIDLVSGGVCEYCGTGLNLIEFDWVIGDYKILEEK